MISGENPRPAGSLPPGREGGATRFFISLLIVFAASAVVFLRHGDNTRSIGYSLICAALTAASESDLRTKRAGNVFPLIILAAGAAGAGMLRELLPMLASGLLFFIPLYLVWRIKKGRSLGGADVKIISSLAFAVGARRALASLAVASISCLCVFAIRRFAGKHAEEKTLPLVPFIAAGTFISMLL